MRLSWFLIVRKHIGKNVYKVNRKGAVVFETLFFIHRHRSDRESNEEDVKIASRDES